MKELCRLRSFDKILSDYEFDKPLSRFLSEFYRANKQMGSKDRKFASALIYNYFRLGTALAQHDKYIRLAVSCFLCENINSPFFDLVITEYTPFNVTDIGLALTEKLKIVKNHFPDFTLTAVFPLIENTSSSINKQLFLESIFIQPKLWIRVKKQYLTEVIEELNTLEIKYSIDAEMPNCIGFKNNTSLDKLESFNKGYFEIQDRSSQSTSKFINTNANEKWWDCCAASGGKSLMLLDKEPTINLTVSDTRESILANLHQRFTKAGIKDFVYYQIDLISGFLFPEPKPQFDGIIVDAPCSGSGTWGRTPEMISSFKQKDIKLYQHKQIQIAENVIPYLKKGGSLIYITCSIFEEENEQVITHLTTKLGLKAEESEIIKGYAHGADSMFVTHLIKL